MADIVSLSLLTILFYTLTAMLGYKQECDSVESRSGKVNFYGFFVLFERFTALFRIFTPFQKMSGYWFGKN
jgi:hypothetical protein